MDFRSPRVLVPMLLGMPLAVALLLPLNVPLFNSEQKAQGHCPGDSIVWAITRLGICNSNAERWYGQTKDGAYVHRHSRLARSKRNAIVAGPATKSCRLTEVFSQ